MSRSPNTAPSPINPILRWGVALLCAFVGLPLLADLPDGFVWDDGYAWFDVTEDSRREAGRIVDEGWRLQYRFRIFGDAPQRSAFRLVLSQDGEELGSLREEGNQRYPGRPGFDWDRSLRSIGQESLVNWKQAVVGAGFYDLEIFYIDGATGEEYLARSYTLDVRATHRVRGAGERAITDGPHYYLNRHGDNAWAFLHQRPVKFPGYLGEGGSRNAVAVIWNMVPGEGENGDKEVTGATWMDGRIRVTVDGEPLNLGNRPAQVRAVTDQVQQVWAEHTDRHAQAYYVGAPYKETIRFVTYETILPLTWRDDEGRLTTRQSSGSITYVAEARPDLVALNDHPGEWEVSLIVNGELIRRWRFEVADNGRVLPWDEAPDDITLHPFAQMIEMDIPDDGSTLDSRLTPDFVREGAFFGLGLPRAYARKVPEKGQPFPSFSAREAYRPEGEAPAAPQEMQAASRPKQAPESPDPTAPEKPAVEPPAQGSAPAAEAPPAVQEATDTETSTFSIPALLIRILLALGMIATGLVLAAADLTRRVGAIAPVVGALAPYGRPLAFATLAIAGLSLVLDLIDGWPILANGIAQSAAIWAGYRMVTQKAGPDVVGEDEVAALSAGSAATAGLAALAFGLIHLLFGGALLV